MLDLADIWATRTGAEVRLVSANDHLHSRNSAHYDGEALDFHSSDPDGLSELFRLTGYRVLWRVPGHYGHVHVEKAAYVRNTDPTLQASKQPPRPAATMRTRAGHSARRVQSFQVLASDQSPPMTRAAAGDGRN